MITAPDLCRLVGYDYEAFRTRRRRARMEVNVATVEHADLIGWVRWLPVKALDEGGRHGRYDANDALLMAVAIEGEAGGLTFADAAWLAWHAGAVEALAPSRRRSSFVIGQLRSATGAVTYVQGTWSDVANALRDHDPATMTVVNVTDVLDRLQERARQLGLAEALGWNAGGSESK